MKPKHNRDAKGRMTPLAASPSSSKDQIHAEEPEPRQASHKPQALPTSVQGATAVSEREIVHNGSFCTLTTENLHRQNELTAQFLNVNMRSSVEASIQQPTYQWNSAEMLAQELQESLQALVQDQLQQLIFAAASSKPSVAPQSKEIFFNPFSAQQICGNKSRRSQKPNLAQPSREPKPPADLDTNAESLLSPSIIPCRARGMPTDHNSNVSRF